MIGIASDHGGLKLKKELIEYLKELNYEIKDYGTMTEESVDYPKYAFLVGEAVSNKEIEKGILICKTGIGMSIACNKVKGIRCAKVDNLKEAELTRLHNDSNVLALNSENILAKEITKIFLETPFSNEERHINRINMIKNYEDKHEY
jgi:ribose 5-phosphate isomerase B